MKIHSLLLFSSMIFSLSGCDKNERQPAATESAEFKSLLMASGGFYFERTLPADLKSTDWIYVAIAFPDGEKKNIMGMSEQGVEFTSDTVKVYFFEEQFGGLPFVAMQVNDGTDGTMGKGATEYAAKDRWKIRTQGKQSGEFSEPLFRFSVNSSISSIGGNEIPEGCFDLILHVDPDQPKANPSEDGTSG